MSPRNAITASGNNSEIVLEGEDGSSSIFTGGEEVIIEAGNNAITSGGSIEISRVIITSTEEGIEDGGNDEINAIGNNSQITIQDLDSFSTLLTDGGNVTLNSLGNNGKVVIQIDNNNPIPTDFPSRATNGGELVITAGNVDAEGGSIQINSQIDTSRENNIGGNVELNALGNNAEIIVQDLDSFSAILTRRGNITFSSRQNSIASPDNGATLRLNSDQTYNAGTGTIEFDNVGVNAGSNTLTLIADEINFDISGNNRLVSGSGNLIL